MKITKKRLRQIIREERAKMYNAETLNEGTKGSPSLGFAGWEPNRRPDFAKAYGRDARVIGQYQNNNTDIMEQPLPASSSDPKENAFQELKMGGAFKELQEMMHDCSQKISDWQNKHEVTLVDAGLESEGVEIEDARLALEDLRQLANQLR